jgi:hypothetical protein
MGIAKPTKLPEWAETSANVVEPSEGKKDDGWLVDEIPPSSYENWVQRQNFYWWRWWDEKLTEGSTDEDLILNGAVQISTSGLALTNAIGLLSEGKGNRPGVLSKTSGIAVTSTIMDVGAMGLAGSGTTTGTLDEIGVVGIQDYFTTDISNAGVFGYSRTDFGVIGMSGLSNDVNGITIGNAGMLGVGGTCNVTGGTLGTIGVLGVSDVTYTGTNLNDAGVMGISQYGVIGIGWGPTPVGGQFSAQAGSGGEGVIATGGSDSTTGGRAVVGTGGAGTTNGVGGFGLYGVGGAGAGTGAGGAGAYVTGGEGAGTGVPGDGLVAVGGSGSNTAGASGADITGGAASSDNGGIGLDVRGGPASVGFTSGKGIQSVGGSNSGTVGGNAASFFGGGSDGVYNSGHGLYARGGAATGTGVGGLGAELQGSSGTTGRSPLRLVPQATPGTIPYTNIQAGEIYFNQSTLEIEYYDGTAWQRIRYVGGP